jgi:hypothetical protein
MPWVIGTIVMECGKGFRKDETASGLTTSGDSDKHDTVSDHHGFEKLDNLSDEFWYDLHLSVSQFSLN